LFGGSGVFVTETVIANPGDLAGGGDDFAEHLDDIVSPGDFAEELVEDLICLGLRKDGSVIDGLAIVREEVFRGN
jgi:hypothetical protein